MVNETKQPTGASVSFKTEFAVSMTCDSCVSSIQKTLSVIPGVEDYSVNLKNKQVVVQGRAPPSVVTRALKDTGRQVLIRGSGTASDDNNSEETQKVFGVARLIQVSLSPVLTLLDLTMRFPGYGVGGGENSGLGSGSGSGEGAGATVSCVNEKATPSSTPTDTPSNKAASSDPTQTYTLYISTTGDLSHPPQTTGPPLHVLSRTLRPDKDGYADLFLELEMGLWEVVGRGMVLEESGVLEERERKRGSEAEGVVRERKERAREVIGGKGRLGILAGVIARSAGVWGNDKVICACSGKTMWEEGRMMDKSLA